MRRANKADEVLGFEGEGETAQDQKGHRASVQAPLEICAAREWQTGHRLDG